jgi:hypothetical protein
MGGGHYSSSRRELKAEKLGYMTAPIHETFKQRSINNAMNPHGITLRESRDSDEHPNSLAIILSLDVTGSMGSVPHHLVKEGLPHIMDSIINGGIPDPQILFVAVGDHQVDRAPLQVGQFESSDELLDKWLTDVYLEGGGGSNAGESYMLAWYFAAKHTIIDCLEKRKKKGYLFTIGDEPVLDFISFDALKEIMGPGQYQDFSALELLDEARKKYHVYHLHIKETASGSRQHVIDEWKQLMADNLIVIQSSDHVAAAITKIVTDEEGSVKGTVSKPGTLDTDTTKSEPEEIL